MPEQARQAARLLALVAGLSTPMWLLVSFALLPGPGLWAGPVGTVVMVHDAKGYEVEFATLSGETIAVVTLEAGDVRPLGPREIAHVREVA
jgi:hypothetical protein